MKNLLRTILVILVLSPAISYSQTNPPDPNGGDDPGGGTVGGGAPVGGGMLILLSLGVAYGLMKWKKTVEYKKLID